MDLPIVELEGSAAQMGEAFGEGCAAAIRELYALRLEAAIGFARRRGRVLSEADVLAFCRRCLPASRAYDPEGYAEFAGIARGAGLTEEQCFALQGFTDLRDGLAFGAAPEGCGCSSFVVAGDRSATGHLLAGQNWDLQTDNMPCVRLVHRRPACGPETWSLTLTGCLSLIGINAAGVAVGNTNLMTTDVRPGVQYLAVIHRALRAESAAEAAACIRDAPRAAAHYYSVAGRDGVAEGLECSACRHAVFRVVRGVLVHCNHALDPGIAALEAEPPGASSLHRQRRLTKLLESHQGPVGIGDLRRFLADHAGGERHAICRHGYEGVSTNASVILCPETLEIHACRGQPHVGKWVTRRLAG